jgi:hypothetical protein
MIPYVGLGYRRLNRQTISGRNAAGTIAALAFYGPAQPTYITLYEVTGSERDIGTAPVIGKPPRVGALVASGSAGGRQFFAASPVLVTGGRVRIDTKLFRATKENVLLEEIPGILSGTVSVDPNADPIWQFEGEAVLSDWLPDPFEDWIAPVIDTISRYEDGSGPARERFQLGLYRVRPYPKRFEQWGGTVLIRGYDPLWTLRASVNGSAYTVNAGTNYSAAVRTILEARGFTRHSIQSTSGTLPKKRTWISGTPWLQIINDLLRSNGFYPLWPDHTGLLRSRRFQTLGSLDPAVTYRDTDVIGVVVQEPDEDRFANHVVVLGNSPSGTSFRRVITNNDPDSPSSTVRLDFTKSIFEKSPDYETQAAVDSRAEYLMERANSMNVRMQVQTKRLRQFQMHEAIAFDLYTNEGQLVADGKWRMERVTIPMGLDAQPEWVVTRLMPFEEVA